MVRISAHETIPGHSDSSLFLTLSIIRKPFKECMLVEAVFSPCKVIVSSNKTEPSHPWNQNYIYIQVKPLFTEANHFKVKLGNVMGIELSSRPGQSSHGNVT